MNRKYIKSKKFIYITALVFIVLFSVGYSALSSTLNIGGSTRYNKKELVRVTGISLQGTSNSGTEQFSPTYNYNTTTTGVTLPALSSTVTYTVTVRNYGSEDKGIFLEVTSNSNSSMTFETSNMPNNNIIPSNSTVTFNITIKYNTSTLPGTKTDAMTITYTFGIPGAMFDTGKVVNAKMKKFVNSSATYSTNDTTITNIARYTGTPNSSYLVDANKVSVDSYMYPIYMWYDSTNTTINWYTEATDIYYNADSSYFFSNLRAINSISNLSDINSIYTTTMENMFYYTGYSSTAFTLNVGTKFNTSNVTNMQYMFQSTGYTSTSFTLELGNSFNTSNVTNMKGLFTSVGHSSTVFTLNLGSNFDTSKVTDMSSLFSHVGYSNTSFILDLGSKFDTSSVTTMAGMFSNTGYSNPSFTLNLGSKFDTSSVTSMSQMFYYTAYNSTTFTLDLGSKFDTSNVTNMYLMFLRMGYKSTVLTLDLGTKFNTSNVTNMAGMFEDTGRNSPVFTLNLGSNFDTSKVTNMKWMFSSCGENSTVLTIDLGDKFDTSNVTDMAEMFRFFGYQSSSFTLNLGSKFDTSKVTNMSMMFMYCGNKNTSFTLDLGTKFDTSKVTNMLSMFSGTGYNSTSYSLNLGDKFDTSNVTTMSGMFENVGHATNNFELDLGEHFNTSNAANMNNMFRHSSKLKTIYAPTVFVTTALTSSTDMFYNCTSLVGGLGTTYNSSYIDATYAHIDGGTSNPGYFTDRDTTRTIYWGYSSIMKSLTFSDKALTSRFITDSGTTNGIFTQASDVPWKNYRLLATSIDFESTVVPTSMAYWFYGFSALTDLKPDTISNYGFDTSHVYSFENTFYNCSSLKWIDLNDFDTSSAISMKGMFRGATGANVISIESFDTSNVKDFSEMFYGDTKLGTIVVSNSFVLNSMTTDTNMFYNCSSLVGENGTSFDSNYIISNRAYIDTAGQPGYFSTSVNTGIVAIPGIAISLVGYNSQTCTEEMLYHLGLTNSQTVHRCFIVPLNYPVTLKSSTSNECISSFGVAYVTQFTKGNNDSINPTFLLPNKGEKPQASLTSWYENYTGSSFTPSTQYMVVQNINTTTCGGGVLA